MARYYISRALISAAFGLLLALTGMTWWLTAITGTMIFAFFLCAPFSGRYAVHPEIGITALRRDERTLVVTDKAARNAFIPETFPSGIIAVTPVNRGDACSRS